VTSVTNIEWDDVASRLAPAPNYWLGTIGRDGSPHATPVWGVVVGDDLYFYTERSTAKAKNLAADPRVVVHLENALDVVIVHGVLEDIGAPSEHPVIVAALDAKYPDADDAQYLPSHDQTFDALYVLRPTRALVWNLANYEETQQRWIGGTSP
jgi:PPOX class probable F420-dependent enzyme